MKDYIFSKAVKLGAYAPGRMPPPAAIVAERIVSGLFMFQFRFSVNGHHLPLFCSVRLLQMAKDPRQEPLYKERIPYVVVAAADRRTQLYQLVQHPEFVLR